MKPQKPAQRQTIIILLGFHQKPGPDIEKNCAPCYAAAMNGVEKTSNLRRLFDREIEKNLPILFATARWRSLNSVSWRARARQAPSLRCPDMLGTDGHITSYRAHAKLHIRARHVALLKQGFE